MAPFPSGESPWGVLVFCFFFKQSFGKLRDTENKLMVARGERVGGWVEKGKGIKKYKLLVIRHRDVQHREYSE